MFGAASRSALLPVGNRLLCSILHLICRPITACGIYTRCGKEVVQIGAHSKPPGPGAEDAQKGGETESLGVSSGGQADSGGAPEIRAPRSPSGAFVPDAITDLPKPASSASPASSAQPEPAKSESASSESASSEPGQLAAGQARAGQARAGQVRAGETPGGQAQVRAAKPVDVGCGSARPDGVGIRQAQGRAEAVGRVSEHCAGHHRRRHQTARHSGGGSARRGCYRAQAGRATRHWADNFWHRAGQRNRARVES